MSEMRKEKRAAKNYIWTLKPNVVMPSKEEYLAYEGIGVRW
jgi:hypothetical protein